MQRNSKLAILLVLMTAAIFAWVPKGKKTKDTPSTTLSASFERAIPITNMVPRKRTEFADWGRNPFSSSQKEEVSDISNLSLSCIIWDDEEARAFINGLVVRVGEKITDKTIKQIERNKVILTDRTKDYVLELRE